MRFVLFVVVAIVCFVRCFFLGLFTLELVDLNAMARTVLGSLWNPHRQDAVLEIGSYVLLLDWDREVEGATEFADTALG